MLTAATWFRVSFFPFYGIFVPPHPTSMRLYFQLLTLTLLSLVSCGQSSVRPAVVQTDHPVSSNVSLDTDTVTAIHVVVALCDNRYQGIVKVPEAIGNGQDPARNLYWGAGYGVKTFFSGKNSNWRLVGTQAVSDTIPERLLFKHKQHNAYLLADAYDGRYIRQCTEDLLSFAAGEKIVTAAYNNKQYVFGSGAKLLAYIGHDGLMDFSLNRQFSAKDSTKRKVIILACRSRAFFKDHLRNTGADPLLWTTGLMAPEAYTLYDALSAWMNGNTDEQVADAAAAAYHRYQSCGVRAARRLLVSGW